MQIQLTQEQARALRELARLRGASISSLVREGVETLLQPERERDAARRKRAMELIGMFDSKGPGDVGERHDEYLADAIRDRAARKRR